MNNQMQRTGQFATPTGFLEPYRLKAQWVRAADVVAIGPLMIWGGAKLFREHPIAGGALALLGVGTIIYNARNWWIVENELSQETLIAQSAPRRGTPQPGTIA
jgi:hypothetical protein